MEAKIDGRQNKATGGPRSKDGTMEIKVYQRDKGKSSLSVTVECYPVSGNTIRTVVKNSKGEIISQVESER